MDASEGLSIGAKLLICVFIVSVMFAIYKAGSNMTNKGLSQAADLTATANDIDKQKYEGMTITGDQVQQVISDYWEEPTCEIVVCTLDGVNAVYNKESTDGTYAVPFQETLTGMPSTDCKGRAFANDLFFRRADAVRNYLLHTCHVAPTRTETREFNRTISQGEECVVIYIGDK